MDILEEVEEFFLTAFLADILSDKIQILTCLLFKWFFLIDSNISLYVDITDLKKKKKYSKPKASVFSFPLNKSFTVRTQYPSGNLDLFGKNAKQRR